MLTRRLRRRPDIHPALGQYIVFAGNTLPPPPPPESNIRFVLLGDTSMSLYTSDDAHQFVYCLLAYIIWHTWCT